MIKDVNVLETTSARSSKQLTSPNSVAIRLAMMVFAGLTLCHTGCNLNKLKGPEAALISYRDSVWARRAYNLRFGNCDRPYSDDFASGFREGYSDVARGGDGYVPAMPPKEYRGYAYQSADGAKCVNAWFEGYPAGVAAAKKDKVGSFNDVLISQMINSAITQDKAEHVLPSDVPIRSSGWNSETDGKMIPVQYSTPLDSRSPNPQLNGPISGMPYPTGSSTDRQAEKAIEAPPIPIVKKSAATAEEVAQTPTETRPTPAIVTGSGVDPRYADLPQNNNQPMPMAVRPANSESTRRTR